MIYKKFQIPCPLPVLDHNVGNLTLNNTLPVHLVMLPNNSESSGVNFMMDYTHQNPAGLDENQAKSSLHGSGVEYEAHSDDKCQPKYFVFNSRVSEEPSHTAESLLASGRGWGRPSVPERYTGAVLFVFQTAYAIPILAFAFVCHPEVLPIYSELKE